MVTKVALALQGAIPMGMDDWETARIQQGRPVEGNELMQDYSPLEAGLYQAVSLNKGCYMGQETLAKVHKQNAVKQQLWSLRLEGSVQPGTSLLSGVDASVIRQPCLLTRAPVTLCASHCLVEPGAL